MNIYVGQMRVYGQDLARNFATMKRMIAGVEKDAMIVFPQKALFGQAGLLQLTSAAFHQELAFYHKELLALSQDRVIVWGSVDEGNHPAVFLADQGQLHLFYQQKLQDDNYQQESRFLKTKKQKAEFYHWQGKSLSFSFEQDLPAPKADLNIVLAKSFFTKNGLKQRLETFAAYKNPVLYVNSVGTENMNKGVFVYDGLSFYQKQPKKVYYAAPFEEKLLSLKDMELGKPEKYGVLPALLTLLKEFDEEVFPFKPQWVLGLSGGLDSAVSFALLVMALGADRVLPVTMPSLFNQATSQNNASFMAEQLACDLVRVPIQDLTQATLYSLEQSGFDLSQGLAYQNVQARLRGHILMSISSVSQGIVVNNGNKLETAFGYATLYGDAIGALSLLADLNKLELGQLALAINHQLEKEVIPLNLIPQVEKGQVFWDFAPSAELAENQADPMKWGYHDALLDYILAGRLEEVMLAYLNGNLADYSFATYLEFYGLDHPEVFIEDLDWLLGKLEGSSFKRLQMPPVAVLSSRAFGAGLSEYQGRNYRFASYESLREKILEKNKG